ncbi:hypothetical protein [Maridesulfovibrio sp.]|uniref:hypothetical protein n=1 Tax=Maridesulfovibrio sp. TaxID=2795000 RepID=UPI0029F4F614|nr:hypothetical protein [Maridesulfovibrio sp.]
MFNVVIPKSGITGKLMGYVEHIQGTKFKFNGEYLNEKGPVQSGPINLSATFNLGSGLIQLESFEANIKKLEVNLPRFGLINPDLTLSGKGELDPRSGMINLTGLRVKAGQLPELEGSFNYRPDNHGQCLLKIENPLPLMERLVELNFPDFEHWEKEGEFSLNIELQQIQNSPKAVLRFEFSDTSAASPEGTVLVESMSGNIQASSPLDNPQLDLKINLKTGEALYDTFYVNLTKNPLHLEFDSPLPDSGGNFDFSAVADWKGIGRLNTFAQIHDILGTPSFTGKTEFKTRQLSAPFRTFVIEPFSLDGLDGSGEFSMDYVFSGSNRNTHLNGRMSFKNCSFSQDQLLFDGINAELPFVLSLNENFLPQADETLPKPQSGVLRFKRIAAGQLEIENFAFPVSVSSNAIQFGTIPAINLEGGSLRLSDLKMHHPFEDDFVLKGKITAKNINMLPLSPTSLPIEGQIGGDLNFWLLKDHLSTTGSLVGKVYGGEMTIDEIFAEKPFEDSRQYGADFELRSINLEPLSQALDIGRITGRMNLDLTGLVIAYNQPASFHMLAQTTPGSEKTGDISLKAVNTLSVIGTGSGLTGAGVGMFSQFFKEFSYAGLGLECTLNDDIFKIRGLIRDDGIEYIIKRPPLFGINVVNSNPENLISFTDMLKRLRRVIGN